MKIKGIIAIFILLVIGISCYVFYGLWKNEKSEIYYSGSVEAISSSLSFQMAGRVITVYVQEGQQVKAGQILAQMDQRELDAYVQQAQANVQRAQAKVGQAEKALSVLKKVLPLDVERAKAGLVATASNLRDANKDKKRFDKLYADGLIAEREKETTTLNYEVAMSRSADARAKLGQAKGNLGKIDIGKRDLEESQANLKLAIASLEQAKIQQGYAKIFAPFDGAITKKAIDPGEVTTPTREVFSIADLSTVDVKIYVAEPEIGKVRLGQTAEVVVDSFPHKKFSGNVTFISPEAEFTPKTIQTKKERVKLVYLVKVSVTNPNMELKAGVPADVYLR